MEAAFFVVFSEQWADMKNPHKIDYGKYDADSNREIGGPTIIRRFDPLRQLGLEGLIVEIDVHVGQHRVPRLQAPDPLKRPPKMRVGGMGRLSQRVDDPQIEPGEGAQAGFGQGDDVSICRPTGAGTCYPNALFPLRTWTLEMDGVYTPDRSVPIKLVAGGGLALPIGVRRNTRVTEQLEHDRTLKGLARIGASLGLGKSVRAPRLQYTRGWLSGAYESFDRIDQLAFVVVF